MTSICDRIKTSSVFISQKVFLTSFCKSQFPNKFVNLFFISVIIKDKSQTILSHQCGASGF